MKHQLSVLQHAILLGLSSLCSESARAAESPSDASVLQLPAVSVTAEKVERPLQKVPASVAVVSGDEVDQSGITSIQQLEGRVSGLSFQPFGQAGMKAPTMRGLTAPIFSYSTSVLLQVDGVPTLMAQGFENSLLDVDRIEVLRGPQSTLYGRNAESGVIAIHSLPMDNTARASMVTDAGSRDERSLRFALSRPLVEDTLYASISGAWTKQDGFIHNIYTGRPDDNIDHQAFNVGLRWTPQASTDVVLRYARQDYNDGGNPWGNVGARRAEVASGTPSWNRSLGQTLSLNASHEIATDLRLRSVTAYNDYRDKTQQDIDFQPRDLSRLGRDSSLRTFSQELRLEGKLGESDWLLGAYGDLGNNDLRNTAKRGPATMDYSADLKTSALALFTHWTVPLTEAWTLTAGARIERDTAALTPQSAAIRREETWSHFSPKLALQYQLDSSNQWYASVNRGVRAGGYNVFQSALNFPSYGPEKTWSYETGVKGLMLDKRLRYSVAAYVMDVKDMQVMMFPSPSVNYIANAATAISRGVDLDLDYLVAQHWHLKSGLAWNHTRFGRFRDGTDSYAGKHNPFAPDLNGFFGLRYESPIGWYAQADVTASSRFYLDPANRYRCNGYGLVNLVTGIQHGNWEIAAFANNLNNKTYDAVGYQGGYVTIFSPPREAGLRLTWRM